MLTLISNIALKSTDLPFLCVLTIASTYHGGSAVPSCGPHSLGLLLGVNFPLLATMSDPYQDGTGHLG